MKWARLEYSRSRVDKAGAFLAGWRAKMQSGAFSLEDVSNFEESLSVINNWRASHSYPLQIMKMALYRRAKRLDESTIVAQRLKRLTSVALKLRRNAHMKLTQMQDIGGCRAVLRNVNLVDQLVDVYEESDAKNPHGRPELVETYDYIEEPKRDGYRSVHMVYKYRTASPTHQVYDGLRVEIQLRSKLQHAWATAVETVSTFTGQALKSNVGDETWKRFFALMGSAIALREERPIVPGTPDNKAEMVEEVRGLFEELKVEQVLSSWSLAVQVVSSEPTLANARAYLLQLDASTRTIKVTGYEKHELADADAAYLRVEKENAGNPDVQAVLVSVDSVAALRTAYPNYYLDTKEFLAAVRRAIR